MSVKLPIRILGALLLLAPAAHPQDRPSAPAREQAQKSRGSQEMQDAIEWERAKDRAAARQERIEARQGRREESRDRVKESTDPDREVRDPGARPPR